MTALTGWMVAAGGGLALAALAYVGAVPGGWRSVGLPALRALGGALLLAALLDVPLGRVAARAGITALDASASLARADRAGAVWRAARDSAVRAGGDLWLLGDSLRRADAPPTPADLTTSVDAAVAKAVAAVAPLTLVTDGVGVMPIDLDQLPGGSRVVVVPRVRAMDAAMVDITAPSAAQVGDTVAVSVRVVADTAMAASTVRWMLDAAVIRESPVPALATGGEALVESRLVMPGGAPTSMLRAVVQHQGDVEPRNDTVTAVITRGAPPRAVVVSTAPDPDVREVVGVLRTSGGLPVTAYYRVAPGRWVRDGSLVAVNETLVREAVRGAALLVVHGDTAAFGPPRQFAARGVLLLVPPTAEGSELYVRRAPASPLDAALSGLAIDSLPPISAGTPPLNGTAALYAARTPTASVQIPVMTVQEGARRRVTFTGTGYARWRTRGGVAATSFAALIGGVSDWLLSARGSSTSPTLASTGVRAGERVSWRRGTDSIALVELRSDAGATVRDTLRFGARTELPWRALAAGVWRGTVGGAPMALVVNPSREWLPAPVTLRSASALARENAPRRGARSSGWPYLVALCALALEWWGRRGAGLR